MILLNLKYQLKKKKPPELHPANTVTVVTKYFPLHSFVLT